MKKLRLVVDVSHGLAIVMSFTHPFKVTIV